MRIFLFFISLFFILRVGYSTNYYCNPEDGNINNNGSIETPWKTLSEVFDAGIVFNPGDTIFLFGGEHGNVTISNYNSDYVVVAAYNGETPILSELKISGAYYWKFIDIDISRPAPATNYSVYNVSDNFFLVQTSAESRYIVFENCNIYTAGVNIETWDRFDWFYGTLSGMMIRGKNVIINNCTIKNTNFALEVRGRNAEFTNSTIENFVGDAIRALSSNSKYEYNTVKNSYDITGYDNNSSGQNPDYPTGPGNHDDLFQSYTSSAGGSEIAVSNVSVRYNKFFSYTNPDQLDKSYTQALGCFDGYYNDWIIENNLIVTDSWHGITLLGVNNAVIAGNTIINNPISNDLVVGGAVVDNMTPFIWVGKTKTGGLSYDNIIRNNLIIQGKFGSWDNINDEGENTTVQNNHTIPTNGNDDYFIDYTNFDFLTKSGSPAIDQGINIDLPEHDLAGANRLSGAFVDCGAYEFHVEGVTEVDYPQIIVYPNPVLHGEILSIDVRGMALNEIKYIDIYDITGKKIYSVNPENENDFLKVNTSIFERKGIYFLNLGNYSTKLLVQ